MNDIFNEKLLYVTENGVTYQYYRRMDNNNLPNYYPGDEKVAINISHNMDEVLFLPIKNEDFNPNRKIYVFGYRYSLYYKRVADNVFHIGFEIRRIRYEVTGCNSIIINKVYDPLHIPRVLQITNNNTMEVGTSVSMNAIMNLISENNNWYLDKQV